MAQLIREGLRTGVWHGMVLQATEPRIEVLLHGAPVPEVGVTDEGDGRHRLSVPIPAEALEDGLQTFVIRDGEEVLGHFTIGAGDGMEADLRAEIDLLRAELELLKRAFRRHCAETSA
ncbi:hypothetical protein [Falsirhodobacter sp. 1013]|uniref:hypothetical protein n=1 Tax=Falsirhodobacter sp. 1013 TaxID=3417566 RepID=UPI003EBC20B4